MQGDNKMQHAMTEATGETDFAVERWTSSVYNIQFSQIEFLQPQPEHEAAFRMSAWGISSLLRNLLADYNSDELHDATEWLTVQQNALVADVLEQMSLSSHPDESSMPPLEQLFITVDGEIFLPRGLVLHVTCVTNIVPYGQPGDGLDKFVAILDPAEVKTYIQERRGNLNPYRVERLH